MRGSILLFIERVAKKSNEIFGSRWHTLPVGASDPASSSPDLTMKESFRIDQTLALVVLAILIAGCFLVLQPFLTAIVWAAILCTTLWPLFEQASVWLGGRRGWAASSRSASSVSSSDPCCSPSVTRY